MTNARWSKLMAYEAEELDPLEIAQGWHFCPEWDGLLIGPGMAELDSCPCPRPDPLFPPLADFNPS